MDKEQFEELKSEIEYLNSNTSYGAINYNELLTVNKKLQNIESLLEENNKLMKDLIYSIEAQKK